MWYFGFGGEGVAISVRRMRLVVSKLGRRSGGVDAAMLHEGGSSSINALIRINVLCSVVYIVSN